MTHDGELPENHGAILGQRTDDWIAGASPIPYEIRVEDGDWTDYLPPGEWQNVGGVDMMDCVTFALLNSIEAQYFLLTGVQRNFSDRFNATMSGTTHQGNFVWKVADSLRNDGLVDEALWPWPPGADWDTYYTFPSTEIINQGRLFLKEWDIKYEWVPLIPDIIRHNLKQAPLAVTIPGHEVLHFFRSESDIKKYFDSYAPFVKTHPTEFLAAMKVVLTKRKDMTETDVKQLQALEGFSDPSGVLYWTGKPLSDYLKARLVDKDKEIKFALGDGPEPIAAVPPVI